MSAFNSGPNFAFGRSRGTLPLAGPSEVQQNAPGITPTILGPDRNAALLAQATGAAIDTGTGILREITRANLQERQQLEQEVQRVNYESKQQAKAREDAQNKLDIADRNAASLAAAEALPAIEEDIKNGVLSIDLRKPADALDQITAKYAQGASPAFVEQFRRSITTQTLNSAQNKRATDLKLAIDAATVSTAERLASGVEPVADVLESAKTLGVPPQNIQAAIQRAADAASRRGTDGVKLMNELLAIGPVDPVFRQSLEANVMAADAATKNREAAAFADRWASLPENATPADMEIVIADGLVSGAIDPSQAQQYRKESRRLAAAYQKIALENADEAFFQQESVRLATDITSRTLASSELGPIQFQEQVVVLPSGKARKIGVEQQREEAVNVLRARATVNGQFDLAKYATSMQRAGLKDSNLQSRFNSFSVSLDADKVTQADVNSANAFAQVYKAAPGFALQHVDGTDNQNSLIAIAELITNDPNLGVQNAISMVRASRENLKINGPAKNAPSPIDAVRSAVGIKQLAAESPAVQSLSRYATALQSAGLPASTVKQRVQMIADKEYFTSGDRLFRRGPLAGGVVENFDSVEAALLEGYAKTKGALAYTDKRPSTTRDFLRGALTLYASATPATLPFADKIADSLKDRGPTAKDFTLGELGDGTYGIYRTDGLREPFSVVFTADELNAEWQKIEAGQYGEAVKAALTRKRFGVTPTNRTLAGVAENAKINADAKELERLAKERTINALRSQGWTDADLREGGYI